ncbi:MAG TPA: hypothetical protein VD994_10030 [Prosthecobacter sp.]|nr:hypothetical protein [Prosthecobacter sp.]
MIDHADAIYAAMYPTEVEGPLSSHYEPRDENYASRAPLVPCPQTGEMVLPNDETT